MVPDSTGTAFMTTSTRIGVWIRRTQDRDRDGSEMEGEFTESSVIDRPLAMLGFSAAAWKTAPRDAHIGWDAEARERNLPLVVNNARFLILPWVRIPNLASHILALSRRQVREDWQARYKQCPVLMESFVEIPRFTGAVYRAAGWVHVGITQGRGKYDRTHECAKPRKDIWLCPLRRDWKRVLNG